MIFYDKRVLSIFTVYFLVVLTFTTGHEGHQNKTVLQLTSNTTTDTQNLDLRNGNNSSAEYVWSNNDDYEHDGLDGYSNDEPASDNESLEPEDGKVNGTVSKPEDKSNSEKDPESDDSSRPPQNSSSVSPTQESPTPVSVAGSSSDAVNSSSSDNTVSSTTPVTVDDSSSSTDSSENEGSTSTPKLSPNPIITEDVGDVSNYTSTQTVPEEHLDSSAFRTWALAIFSVLISFAAIFTILYFIRNELIRRRKADQRRLLRGSVSSEGYFYGDGDGSTKGNFEL